MSGPVRSSPLLAGPFDNPSVRDRVILTPERRQLIRSAASAPIFVSWHGSTLAVTVLDATPFGIRLAATLPKSSVGDAVLLSFAGGAVLRGQIRWCGDGHVGVRLVLDGTDVLDHLGGENHGVDYFTHVIAWQKRRLFRGHDANVPGRIQIDASLPLPPAARLAGGAIIDTISPSFMSCT